jgi:uridine kinase
MKRKIRCICIDGMEKTGKTSVTREMRKFFKEKDKDLHEINGNEYDKLQLQRPYLMITQIHLF